LLYLTANGIAILSLSLLKKGERFRRRIPTLSQSLPSRERFGLIGRKVSYRISLPLREG
jgi:hypothetical protein